MLPLARGMVFVVLLFGLASALADNAHDKLVYARYGRKVAKTLIKYPSKGAGEMKHRELAHPATKKDVEEGKAVFTFEGLGPGASGSSPNAQCPPRGRR